MCDEWMPTLQLAITYDEWRQLPRNASYKYEYIYGKAWLTPQPKFFHALLDLSPLAGKPLESQGSDITIQPFTDGDWIDSIPIFAAAFARHQPFGSLEDKERQTAAGKSLEYTRTGGDGPVIPQASFTAWDARHSTLVGAILVTLLPDADPTEWNAFQWKEPPPPDCLERRAGRPHLTWVFVAPFQAGEGVGTALLDAAVRGLLQQGYTKLASTFLAGNESSTLWHWRNGFRLLTFPGSRRKLNATAKPR